MNRKKYVGMDIHKATISVAAREAAGKLTMESTIETKAATILEFVHGLGDPRRNALLRGGSKNDKVDARKLSDLLRAGLVSPVYHGDQSCRTLKEFARSYLTTTKDFRGNEFARSRCSR